MDPAQNADYAAGMLSGLLHSYGGDVHAALSAYNAGSPTATGTTTNWGGGVTLGYADSVMAHYAQLGGTARDTQIADLPATSANVNQLQSLASASNSPAGAASAVAASPAPSLPTTQQQTQAQASAAQPPLKGDFYADGDE
jgi:hypothetical protein